MPRRALTFGGCVVCEAQRHRKPAPARLRRALRDTDADAAVRLAETLRRRIATLDFEPLTGGLPVRVSIGVAQLSETRMNAVALVSAADAAMYEAKRQGRDRVCVAP